VHKECQNLAVLYQISVTLFITKGQLYRLRSARFKLEQTTCCASNLYSKSHI